MKNITLLLLFILSFHNSLCQTTPKKQIYSKRELISFLKIYKHTLDNPFDPLVSLNNNYKKSKLTEERLTEIFQAEFAGNPVTLSESEKVELQKLKEMVEIDKKNYDNKLDNYISENNLTKKKYYEIKKKYHEDSSFQKKVLKTIKS